MLRGDAKRIVDTKAVMINELCVWSKFYGQATKSMRGDALAQEGEEGRG
jgi:hypothetical protein